MSFEESNEESEIFKILRILNDNGVEIPNYINNEIVEIKLLQSFHDLICAKLRHTRTDAVEDIMKFFLEWKTTNS